MTSMLSYMLKWVAIFKLNVATSEENANKQRQK